MKPVFGQRAEFVERSKHDAAVQKALVAIRQLGIGVVKRCEICKEMPYETSLDTWPCNHRGLFDKSLRDAGHDLAVLNDAARIWVAEKATAESEGIEW